MRMAHRRREVGGQGESVGVTQDEAVDGNGRGRREGKNEGTGCSLW